MKALWRCDKCGLEYDSQEDFVDHYCNPETSGAKPATAPDAEGPTEEDFKRLYSFDVPSRYSFQHRFGEGLPLEERLKDAIPFVDLYLKCERRLTMQKRNRILNQMGFMTRKQVVANVPAACVPSGMDADGLVTELVRANELKPITHFAKFFLYPREEVMRAIAKLEEGTKKPEPTTTQVPTPLNVQDPELRKLEPLLRAPYVDAEAIKALLPLLTMNPMDRIENHHGFLRSVSALTQLLFKANKERGNHVTNLMKKFGRGAGAARIASKLDSLALNIGWEGEPKEERVGELSAVWVYTTLVFAYILSEFPEARQKTIVEMIRKGIV